VPVWVVGNLSVGGNGKTPSVIALCELLKQQGLRPGIVSGGYAGTHNKQVQPVTASSDPLEVGDEAVLLALKTNCPMVIGRDRVAATKYLLSHYSCDLVISDDGLQHYRLGRNKEIILIGSRGFGNEHLLPAGPLRESLHRLQTVDAVWKQGEQFTLQFQPLQLWGASQKHAPTPNTLAISQPIHAMAGIAAPERFFEALMDMGYATIKHPFTDHHRFTNQDFPFNDDLPLVMTEKDAVKCQYLLLDLPIWVLPMNLVLSDEVKKQVLEWIV